MRTITMQEAEEKARTRRSEAWLALASLLQVDAEAEALGPEEKVSTIVDTAVPGTAEAA